MFGEFLNLLTVFSVEDTLGSAWCPFCHVMHVRYFVSLTREKVLSSSHRIHAHLCCFLTVSPQRHPPLFCPLWCSPLGWNQPPVALHPSSLCFFLFFIYTYACAPQASPKSIWFPLACGHNTERTPHQSSLHSAHREERRAKRAEEDERKSGTNSDSHTHHKSVFAHGKIVAHICGGALRIHQSRCPTA